MKSLHLGLLMVILSSPLSLMGQSNRIVVAQDGSGDFTSIAAAVNSRPDHSQVRIIIFVKNGTYREKLVVPSWKTNITLIGEDKEKTIITYDDFSGKVAGMTTFTTYTVLVQGNDFRAENLTIENTAGPTVSQAVALHVEADRCVFRNCRLIANQDTLYLGVDNSRQYFVDCYIEGTTDFIFGPSTAVFQNCAIHCKKNSYITAASTTQGKSFGFVFFDCLITHSPEADKVYLGRPWRPFAKTVFIRCNLGVHILPEGWHNWNKPAAEKTSYYGEFKSAGKGGSPAARVSWSHQLTEEEAGNYTLLNILVGWNPDPLSLPRH